MRIEQSTANTTTFTIDLMLVGYTTYLTSLGVQRHKLTFSGDNSNLRHNQIDTPNKNAIIDKLARVAPKLPARCLLDVMALQPIAA